MNRIILALALILSPAMAWGQTTTGSFTGSLSPPAAGPVTVFLDTFTGDDGTALTSPSHHPDVGSDWTVVSGTWTLVGGWANGTSGIAIVDVGYADITISANVYGTLGQNIVYRYGASNSFFTATREANNGGLVIYEYDGDWRIRSTQAYIAVAGELVTVTLLDEVQTVVAGATTTTYTHARNKTVTNVGIAVAVPSKQLDNLTVTR